VFHKHVPQVRLGGAVLGDAYLFARHFRDLLQSAPQHAH
jgi:hypothetical protein